jgi:hypothetical protein
MLADIFNTASSRVKEEGQEMYGTNRDQIMAESFIDQ